MIEWRVEYLKLKNICVYGIWMLKWDEIRWDYMIASYNQNEALVQPNSYRNKRNTNYSFNTCKFYKPFFFLILKIDKFKTHVKELFF